MSPIILFLFTFFITLAASKTVQLYELEKVEELFENFILQYEKKYNNEYEKTARFKIFKDNLVKVNQMNERSKHAVYGITKFMDLTNEEYITKTSTKKPEVEKPGYCKLLYDKDVPDVKAPDAFDWRDRKVVTDVKDEGACAASHIFSPVACIESQYAIKYGKLLDLSEQQVLDCEVYGTSCGYGDMAQAMSFICQPMEGLMSEADYPYVGRFEHFCKYDYEKIKVFVDKCHSYNLTSQEKLKQLLHSHGPISVALRKDVLYVYHGGIISDEECSKGKVDHMALLVGYGTENGTDYWIVKNSWGKTFGEQGYFRMQRGEGAISCGVMNFEMVTADIK